MKEILLSIDFYSKKAIEDTVYWLSEKYIIQVDVNDCHYIIHCQNMDGEFEHIFYQRLNDFNLRESIRSQTSEIKDLIIAKAFYPEMVDIDPVGSFEDPVDMEKKDEAE